MLSGGSARTLHRRSRVLHRCSVKELREEEDPRRIAEEWIRSFQSLWNDRPVANDDDALNDAVAQLFVSTPSLVPFWRDMVAFTWNIVTLEGLPQISAFLRWHHPSFVASNHRISEWTLDAAQEIRYISTASTEATNPASATLEFWTVFHIDAVGTGRAHVRLRRDTFWKAHTLLTTLQSLQERPWNVAPTQRPLGVQEGIRPNRQYWPEQQQRVLSQLVPEQFTTDNQSLSPIYVVVIGAGQGGLSLAARLHALQVPYVVLEAGPSPGTSWRRRYPSLHLHDPVYYNHMPYIPFPSTWPLFCPRDKIATWMEFYAQALDLHVQCHTTVRSAQFDDVARVWNVHVEYRDPSSAHPEQRQRSTTISCHHLVFATGNSSFPRRPFIPGRYGGIQLHSSQYQGGKHYESHGIRHVVVIGSNNSAFDICQDLWEQLSVQNGGTVETITMIQRTPAMVVSTESVLQHGLGPLYAEQAALHHEEADLVATTVPYKLAMEKWQRVTKQMQETDAKMLHDLTQAGYRLDTGPNGTGIFAKSATEGGGFYIDNGCATLVSRGDVSVCYAKVDALEDSSIRITHLEDGRTERRPADMVVFATGFGTIDQWVDKICGPSVAAKVGRTWGLGLGHKAKDPGPWEGELRNMWKPVSVEGLWFQGGNLAQNRHYSRYLALQLAARYAGIETTVYGIPKPTAPSL